MNQENLNKLKEWLRSTTESKESVVILCHDDPDPDCIASAFAMSIILDNHGIKNDIYWGGEFTHVQNRIFMNALEIPMIKINGNHDEIKSIINNKKIIQIDTSCDLWENSSGNLKSFSGILEKDQYSDIVIDHHKKRAISPEVYIHENYGACSSIMYEILVSENIEISKKLATALYFGIQTDTNNFSSLTQEDRNIKDNLIIDLDIYKKIEEYPKPLKVLNLLERALTNKIVDNDLFIAGVSIILPEHKSLLAEIANMISGFESIKFVCIIGIIDEGYGNLKHLVVSFRNSDDILNTNDFMKTVFGDNFGGRKGYGGGSMTLSELDCKMFDACREDYESKKALFNRIFQIYAHDVIEKKRAICASGLSDE